MARYTGPKARVSRRLGTNIFGTKGETVALEKRPYPPGEHGRTRRRGNPSEYLLQMQEKQKARFTYGLSEKQFRNLYEEANRREGVTGENMLRFLELRLDNVVYRLGFAPTRRFARQLVSHGHFTVNGTKVTIPSLEVRVGDVIAVREGSRKSTVFADFAKKVENHAWPNWLKLTPEALSAEVKDTPKNEEQFLQLGTVLEFYSR